MEDILSAARAGNIDELYASIRRDAKILERIDEEPFVDTPLHVAAAAGHTDFAMEILKLKPSFGRKLNQDGFSPVHVALQKGQTETVICLVKSDKELIRVKGREGYTPLHCVTKEGNVLLLAKFLDVCPKSIEDVTIREENAIHIAAQNNRLDALEILVRWIQKNTHYTFKEGLKFLRWEDRDGNTALHAAVSNDEPQPQMIRLLLIIGRLDKDKTNSRGETASDLLQNRAQVNQESVATVNECHRYLIDAVRSIFKSNSRLDDPASLRAKITIGDRVRKKFVGLEKMNTDVLNAVLVVLVLIITATYQAALSPPEGFRQQNDQSTITATTNSTTSSAVKSFHMFYFLNSLVFFTASILTIIILLVCSHTSSYALFLIIPPLVLFQFNYITSAVLISPNSSTARSIVVSLFTSFFFLAEIFIGPSL